MEAEAHLPESAAAHGAQEGQRRGIAAPSWIWLVVATTSITAVADLLAMALQHSVIPPVLIGALLSLAALGLLRWRERAGLITIGVLTAAIILTGVPFAIPGIGHPDCPIGFIHSAAYLLGRGLVLLAVLGGLFSRSERVARIATAIAASAGLVVLAVATVATISRADTPRADGDIRVSAERFDFPNVTAPAGATLCGDGVAAERGHSLFAALAVDPDVGPGAEVDVVSAQGDEFGDPEPGLDGDDEEGVVASTAPSGLVGGGEQNVDLVGVEERDQGPVPAFGRDGQDAGDGVGVLGMPERGVAEQGPDGGEAGVAGGDAHASVVFEVGEQGADRRGVEVVEVQVGGLDAGGVGHPGEQQANGVAVGEHRVRAGVALTDEPFGEERLHGRRDPGHCRSLFSRRSQARASRSADADRYQYVHFGSA